MKRLCAIFVFLILPLAAQCAEEDQLLDVLQSSQSSLQDKDAACSRLKWIGTARAVPALEKLLTDEDLSHSARYALESMPGPEAENALRQALSKTSGSNEVGIINSLGFRADASAVPDLAGLTENKDAPVAAAAANALGHIGGADAVKALENAWDDPASGAAHEAQTDALLACAYRMQSANESAAAAKIFQKIYDREQDGRFRLAAFRGLILSSEKHGIELMMAAIAGSDGPNQGAALELAAKAGGPATTRALGKALLKAPVAVQIALLHALAQRRDRYAVPWVIAMVESTDPDVRLAAITALGDLRDGRATGTLLDAAAAATGAEKNAARDALDELVYGGVTQKLVEAVNNISPGVQAEAIRALGQRGDVSAAPKLIEVARGSDDTLRAAAFQALAQVAGAAQVPDLVQLVVSATNDDARSESADALGTACQHIQSRGLHLDATSLAQAARTAPPEARVALLGVCNDVSDAQIRDVLRAAMNDPDEHLREAAFRALLSSQDEGLLPDMLAVIGTTKSVKYRMLGIRGCAQLIEQAPAGALPVAQKVDALKSLLADDLDEEGKRVVLSAMVAVPDPQTLEMATGLLGDAQVKAEAADATVQIALAIWRQYPAKSADAVKKALPETSDENIQKTGHAILKRIKQMD